MTIQAIVAPEWTLRSQTNHSVYSDGLRWMKVPMFTNPFGIADLDTEAKVWAMLGVQTERDGSALIVPDQGRMVTDLEARTVVRMVDRVVDISSRISAPGLTTLLDRTRDKVWSRGSLRALDWLPTDEPDGCTQLIHADPQISNWVHTHNGVSLIDWESAVAGPVDQGLGTLWVCLAKSHPWVTPLIEEQLVDLDAFRHGARCKMALVLSWMEWRPSGADNTMLQNLHDAVLASDVMEPVDQDLVQAMRR